MSKTSLLLSHAAVSVFNNLILYANYTINRTSLPIPLLYDKKTHNDSITLLCVFISAMLII